MHHGSFYMLFVNRADDDTTTCAFSRGCCEVNGTAVKAVCEGLSHLSKYDFYNIVKTNIPLRFEENIKHFYLSDSEKH